MSCLRHFGAKITSYTFHAAHACDLKLTFVTIGTKQEKVERSLSSGLALEPTQGMYYGTQHYEVVKKGATK